MHGIGRHNPRSEEGYRLVCTHGPCHQAQWQCPDLRWFQKTEWGGKETTLHATELGWHSSRAVQHKVFHDTWHVFRVLLDTSGRRQFLVENIHHSLWTLHFQEGSHENIAGSWVLSNEDERDPGGLEGCNAIMDNTVIYGHTEEEQDEHLNVVLKWTEESGLRLNTEKCHFKQRRVKFFGHIISEDWVWPDPNKVKAITEMPLPTSVTELKEHFVACSTTWVGLCHAWLQTWNPSQICWRRQLHGHGAQLNRKPLRQLGKNLHLLKR